MSEPRLSVEAPHITIGVTCFNAEETIERALVSALEQDWPNFEIVVVDDGSSDRSREVITRVAARDSRIKLAFHEVNKGFPTALNTIIANATGEYLAIFDDDDVSVPERLRLQYERLTKFQTEKNTELVFCYGGRDVIHPDGRVVIRRAIGHVPPEPQGMHAALYLLSRLKPKGTAWGSLGCCTLMAKLSTIHKVGCFDPDFRRVQDREIAVRLSLMGGYLIGVNQTIITQYVTPTADKAGTIRLKAITSIVRKHRSNLEEQNLYLFSLAMAHAQFFASKKAPWRKRLYLVLAFLLRPRSGIVVFADRWSI
ncbi:MAG: glycosyltransferase [Parvibaculum sp.]